MEVKQFKKKIMQITALVCIILMGSMYWLCGYLKIKTLLEDKGLEPNQLQVLQKMQMFTAETHNNGTNVIKPNRYLYALICLL